ncbi:MAG: amidase family protein [Ilumatobacteraceae bacterium]
MGAGATNAQPLLSVGDLAAAYRRRCRPLSPVEVTEVFLERIERFDERIRSMVTVTPDLARRHARTAAGRIAGGDPSPLLGIPLVVKDLIDVRGVRTTAGSAVLRDNVATSSAPAWQRLARAGAVLLGKANTHEFAYGGITEPTVNPWHTNHLVGGSSGGPGAALAAGLALMGIGTDTAGSIRIPANLCGVAGLKPTRRTVSTRGVIPLAPSLDVVGPMGHHPRDLALAMGVLAQRWASDAPDALHRAAAKRAAAGALRIGVLADPGRMTPGVQAAFERTVATAATFGATIEVRVPHVAQSVWTNFTILGVEAVLYHERWRDQRELYTPYVRERLADAESTSAVAYVERAAGRLAVSHRPRPGPRRIRRARSCPGSRTPPRRSASPRWTWAAASRIATPRCAATPRSPTSPATRRWRCPWASKQASPLACNWSAAAAPTPNCWRWARSSPTPSPRRRWPPTSRSDSAQRGGPPRAATTGPATLRARASSGGSARRQA